MFEYETIEVAQIGHVATVSLNRPQRLNAITSQMLDEITHAYSHLTSDIRIVVLTGRGRAFCSGADRSNPPGLAPDGADEATVLRHADTGNRACRAIGQAQAITVARLHGHVIGGGAVFALNCDFRIGDSTTSISFPEVRLGIPLAWGAWPVLEREIGTSRARHAVLFGEAVAAEEAKHLGLLHEVVPPDRLEAEADRFVDRLTNLPELSVRMTKQQLLSATSHDLDERAALDARLYAEAMCAGWNPFPDSPRA